MTSLVGTHIHTFCSLLPFLSPYSLYLQLVVVNSDPRSHSTAHVSPCLTWLCTYLLGTLFVFFFSSIHIFFAPRSSVLPMNSRNSGGGSHSRLNPPPLPAAVCMLFFIERRLQPYLPPSTRAGTGNGICCFAAVRHRSRQAHCQMHFFQMAPC